jgi:hypothetical protein
MKHAFLLVSCLLIAVPQLFSQDRGFGLGIVLGEPSGISGKLWTSQTNAFDFCLGWSATGDRYYILKDARYYHRGGVWIHFHADYLWHSFNTIRSKERFPLYYGVGVLLGGGDDPFASIGVRGVLGIAWLARKAPFDVFLEIAPVLHLAPFIGLGMNAGLGGRYYF